MKTSIAAAALALFATSLSAQSSIINIKEVDEDGNTIVLTDTARIVDINSTLNLTIDRAALDKYLEQKGLTGSASDVMARIDTLSNVLKRSDASLLQLQQAFASYPGPNAAPADRKAHWARTAAGAADAALLVQQEPQLNSYLNALLIQNPQAAANPVEQYRLVYVAAANIARDLQGQIDQLATTNGVYVQMGAWIESRAIHIEGFDDYPADERFVVERWSLALSQDEQTRLTAYAELAKKVNADGWKTLLSWKTVGPSLIQAYLQETKSGQCAASLSKNFAAAKSQTWASAADVQQKLDQGQKDAQDFIDFLEGLKKKYSTGGSAGALAPNLFLVETNNDVQALVNRTNALPALLTADANAVVKAVTTGLAAAQNEAQNLLTQAKQCGTDAQSDAEEIQDKILKSVKFLLGEREFDTAALELGDKVRKLSMAQIPSTVSIPLVNTGRRDPGDHFTVKFAVGTADTAREVVATRQLSMYRILWHFDLKANLIWADPGKSTSVHHFQAAPAYNVLLKHGMRNHVLWNSLFDPGAGMNLAALDFNHDDTQELGVGLALSIFRDLLTAGYGYNVVQGVPYWYFGLRLPLPGTTLNGAKTAPAK